MSNQEKLSLKSRITIAIKKTRPLHWSCYIVAAAALFAALWLVGAQSRKPKAVTVPAELTGQAVQFRMTVVGDVNVSDNIRALATEVGYKNLFQNLSAYWSASDHTVATVSGPVLTYDVQHYTSTRSKGAASMYLRPAALRGLLSAGIDLLNFANDDAYNYGITGMVSTLRELDAVGAEYLGIASSKQEPLYKVLQYEYSDANGAVQQRAVAVMGVNDVIPDNSTVRSGRAGLVNSTMEALYTSVYEASQSADIVVVCLHIGASESGVIEEDRLETAQELIDAGATLVVCSGAGAVQPIVRYGNGLIVCGLGDVITDADFSLSLDSAMLDLVVSDDGMARVYISPLRVLDGMPQRTDDPLYLWRITHVLTSQLDESAYTITEDDRICIPLAELPQEPILPADTIVTEEEILAGEEGLVTEDEFLAGESGTAGEDIPAEEAVQTEDQTAEGADAG